MSFPKAQPSTQKNSFRISNKIHTHYHRFSSMKPAHPQVKSYLEQTIPVAKIDLLVNLPIIYLTIVKMQYNYMVESICLWTKLTAHQRSMGTQPSSPLLPFNATERIFFSSNINFYCVFYSALTFLIFSFWF